jgi:hypothetical protein
VTPSKDKDLCDLMEGIISDFEKEAPTKTKFIFNLAADLPGDALKLNIYRSR